ncbi:hypothetical protein [Pontibacter sp. H249]|uniref:hypothetical protein n=1 Tax=Pontibacter sp. H249 TaxID=3133420 RepID=UPI0030C2FD55
MIHSLRIWFNSPSREVYDSITQVLGVEPQSVFSKEVDRDIPSVWMYEVDVSAVNDHYDYINKFCDLLDGRYDQLKEIGIEKNQISIWTLYGYEGQCNIEYDPKDLKRLGDNGVKLCFSCWDNGYDN